MNIHSSCCPPSAISQLTGWVGLIGFLCGCAMLFLNSWPAVITPMLLVVSTGAPMWILEWRRHRSSRSHLSPHAIRFAASGSREARWMGLMLILLMWCGTLGLFSIAQVGNVSGFWDVIILSWPAALLLTVIFLYWAPADNNMDLLGHSALTLRQKGSLGLRWDILRDHFVKAFFLPLMIGSTSTFADQVLSKIPPFGSGLVWFLWPMALLYLIDVTFASVGYLSTFRRFDAHIRSSNPYWTSWIFALVCYPPFFTWLGFIGLTQYKTGPEWHHWLHDSEPLVIYIWGGAILFLTAIYAWATIAFGIRFSNLTHRGIITHGPFRWTKHPAYIAKNLSWWLFFTPFLSHQGTGMAVTSCITLLCINFIYLVRAKTEEKHLLSDPEYRKYSQWIKENGLFAIFHRRLQWQCKNPSI